MSQPNAGVHAQYTGDNVQHHGRQLGEPYSGHNGFDLSTHPLPTTSIPPSFSSDIYPPNSSGFGIASNRPDESSNLATEALAQKASWSSGAQSVPQIESFDFRIPTGDAPVSLSEATPMRYFHTNLAVLSADQYDNDRYSKRPTTKVSLAKGKPKSAVTVVPADSAPNPKKRGRKPASDDEERESTEPAGEAKRTRGRPRLDTKDQTPTERRRTQIRLAQRAYRNRKESAITDLQAKINDLKDVNTEINNAYQNLFDYAAQRGLLNQAPEFGQQLQRLQDLIKQTQEKDSPRASEEDSHSDDALQETHRTEDVSSSNEGLVSTQPEVQPTHLWAGLQVSHEPVVQQDILATTSNLDPALRNPQEQYEIVTAPTHNNASFGPNFSIDPNFINPVHSNWAQHPWNRLTGPRTMSFNEWAFARRLHRHCVERASVLAHMPNPPPDRLNRVFGFVALFETMDEIRSRSRATLDRIRDQPLNYWEHPFHSLGGSGTHFTGQEDASTSLAGSSSYQSTGFGIGPYNEQVMKVRDTMLGVSQYINMTGWEGTWYDAGEVETYLVQNGIVIPTAADIYTVEVPPNAFSDVQSPPQIQLMQTIPPNATHMSHSMPHSSSSYHPGIPASAPLEMSGAAFEVPTSIGSSANLLPARDDPWAPVSVTSSLYGATQAADGGIPSFTGFDNMGYANSASYLFPHHVQTAPTPMASPKRVLLDVNKFIDRLISHATCLGRSPAFRPKDIAASFWDSVIAD